MSNLDIKNIINLIPHRYPMLLVDRMIEINLGESAIGVKNISFNEPQFMGHFPDNPVMPGVLIVEAMAQVSAVLVAKTIDGDKNNKLIYFMSIDQAKFRKIVIPGDTMYIHTKKIQARASVWKFSAEALVNDQVVAEATFTAMIKDKE